MFEITNFCQKQLKFLARVGETSCKEISWSYDMEGHCEKSAGEQKDRATVQSLQLNALDDHQFKEEGIGNHWRIVESLLTNCLEVPVFGHELEGFDILWSVNKLAQISHKNGLGHVADD